MPHALPSLDTVSFDCHLPLDYQPQGDAHAHAQALLTTRLALAILAGQGDVADSAPAQQRLEARLDLMLELALQQRYPLLARHAACRIGLEAVAWYHHTALPPGSQGLLSLQVQSPSALTLQLPLTIRHCQPQADGFAIVAGWGPALGDAQAAWERWVFRRHRQSIGRQA